MVKYRKRNGARSGGNGSMSVAGPFRPGSTVGTRFTDTVELLSSATGTGFFLSVAELLPSLQSGSNRNFVFNAFRVELLPANDINSPARIAQVRFRAQAMNEFVAMHPYKVLSRVNPSMILYSVDRLARFCPTAKDVHSTVDTTLVFNLGFANENRESVVARITTIIRILPQTNTLTTALSTNTTFGTVDQRGNLLADQIPTEGAETTHPDEETSTLYL